MPDTPTIAVSKEDPDLAETMERSLAVGKPRIGVTGPARGGFAAWLFTWLAIRRAGARAVRLRPQKDIPAGPLHGLVLGGGADVNPELRRGWARATVDYMRESTRAWPRRILDLMLYPLVTIIRALAGVKREESFDTRRDHFERRVLQHALKRDLPVLGICRGAQLINIMLGGTLHSDIQEFYGEMPLPHTVLPRQYVRIEAGSRLHQVLQAERCRVNALHHQSIRQPGRGMSIVACNESGVVQAVENSQKPFLIGVQWHPEYLPQLWRQQEIFRALVTEAERKMHQPEGNVRFRS